MEWLQRYLGLFEGEPAWLIVLVSVIMLTGVVVIVEKLIKLSTWLLAASLVLGLVAGAVVLILYW